MAIIALHSVCPGGDGVTIGRNEWCALEWRRVALFGNLTILPKEPRCASTGLRFGVVDPRVLAQRGANQIHTTGGLSGEGGGKEG